MSQCQAERGTEHLDAGLQRVTHMGQQQDVELAYGSDEADVDVSVQDVLIDVPDASRARLRDVLDDATGHKFAILTEQVVCLDVKPCDGDHLVIMFQLTDHDEWLALGQDAADGYL